MKTIFKSSRRIIRLALALVFIASAQALHAQTVSITFDSITDTTNGGLGTLITGTYLGFNWNNIWIMNGPDKLAESGASGYSNGLESTPNVGLNGYGQDASFSNAAAFTFKSGYFSSAWNDNLTVSVEGLRNGQVVDTKTFVVNPSGPTLETFNWSNITQVDFSSSGGTLDPFSSCSGEQFVMDSLSVDVTTIPEPGTYALLGIGGAGLLMFARRRQKAGSKA